MSQTVTLELPDELAKRARTAAAAANRPLEEAAVEWIARAVAESPPDPAVFSDDVRRFAAERDVTHYLAPLYELARRSFEGAGVTVSQEFDAEIAGLGWIVFAPAVGEWDLERYRAAKARWYAGFKQLCPSDASINFVLGVR